jgi:hypothetical protein
VRQLSVREREERQGGGGLTRRTHRRSTALSAPTDNASASKTIFFRWCFSETAGNSWETPVMLVTHALFAGASIAASVSSQSSADRLVIFDSQRGVFLGTWSAAFHDCIARLHLHDALHDAHEHET